MDSIILEKYVCRNCNLPFILEDYIKDDTLMKNINSSPYELMNTSKFTDEGVENINEKYGKEK